MSVSMPHGVRLVALAATVVFALPTTAGAASAQGPPEPGHRAPVSPLVVTRPMDAPDGPYAAGHRGVDLAAFQGQDVRASADGVVRFSGSVAGELWVSVAHPDGVVTSYGRLQRATVRAGESVLGGQTIGHVGVAHPGRVGLHWGARDDRGYLDPMRLLDLPWQGRLDGPGGWTATPRDDLPHYGPWSGEHRWGFVPGSPIAEGPGWSLPPNPNHVITVAGLNSHTGNAAIRATDLGYRPEDVTELSYSGRHDGVGDPDDPRRDQAPYTALDTHRGVREAALRLDAQLRAQWARSPGQAVDLVGHSMGGVVIMYYLLHLHDPADPAVPPIDHVATIASPLDGADAAAVLADIGSTADGEAILQEVGDRLGHDVPGEQVREDLHPGGALVGEIGERWQKAHDDFYAGPLALGTELLTVGGQTDYIVPPHRSDLPDAQHVMLPGDHTRVRDTEASRIVLRAFLAGEPVPGESGGLGYAVSYGTSAAERIFGKIGAVVGWMAGMDPVWITHAATG